MKKILSLLILASFISLNAYSTTIRQLFDALKNQPQTKVDEFFLKSAKAGYSKTTSLFWPKIYATYSYTHYNSPTNLRPLTPTKSSQLMQTNGNLPFSKNIYQIGVNVSMPVFVYPLFSLTKKAQALTKAAKIKKKLNFIRNEAAIVSLNAQLEYIKNLKKAIEGRINSLNTQLNTIKRAVKLGRAAPIEALKIEDSLNRLNIQLNKLNSSEYNVIMSIYTLTGIKLNKPAGMELARPVKEKELFQLKPLEYNLQASKYELKAKEGELLPSIYMQGFIARKFGKSYNTNKHVLRNYGSIGLYLQIPIFDKVVYSDIEKAKSDYIKNRYKLQEYKRQLIAQSKSTKDELKILSKSIILAKKNIKNSEELLKYAKVAFRLQRMTEEEYLRYEDNLLSAKAELLELKLRKWQDISKLAIIYGNDLKEIVR
ncbi:TolC family protein [Hippea maritima]|uniref:Outer membrane efflux protein n=1 Tax=Hippea maritima (strain ATCC 700847 / DSM 10411 / MH2) TaxID=760142 RepID=F2LY54_HIPMA|nr:TolC family protein [Hippea maritima]AEA34377.1 outer membrane efflux protein [Hippea maritima DSM 10411]